MTVEFTAHNIRLDDGTFTKPEIGYSMEFYPWFVSARRVMDTVFPGDKQGLRLVDLGCLEGGYAVEFARMGFRVLGMDVREANIAACQYVKSKTDLPNLDFVRDDVWNIARYGTFDAVFCCGLLYHLDQPRHFLQILSSVTTKLLFLQTHFSTGSGDTVLSKLLPAAQRALAKLTGDKHNLSALSENEGLAGRWYTEFPDDSSFRRREDSRWASWENRRSFWVQREYLLQTIWDVGFDLALEQFDSLGPDIAESMLRGLYREEGRGTFIGIKTEAPHAATTP
jgi:hypothetical protein